MSGSEINGLRAGAELSEISVPGPTPVRERFVDNSGEDRMHQLDADLLPHLAAEPSVRRLSGLQQATGREPQFPCGGSANADQDYVSSAVVDETACRPERRPALPAKRGIVR